MKGEKKAKSKAVFSKPQISILCIYTTAAAFDHIINTYRLRNASLSREAHFKDL